MANLPLAWIINTATTQQHQVAKETTLIGRAHHNDLIVEDPYVSADHASVVFRDGLFLLYDRGARVKIKVNDIEIDGPKQLYNQDRITLGQTVFQFLSSQ
jgi:predicted component of type VI protein secretion system